MSSPMIFQKINMIFYKHIVLVFFLIFNFTSFAQQDFSLKPGIEKSVYDNADMLNDSEEMRLRQKLETYADTTSTQIVIVTLTSLNGRYIATYATEWAEKWGIGQKGKDNGAIIMVSKEDKKITIQNGYGLETYLTDYNSKTIIDKIIQPAFRKGDFYKGFDEATTAMFQLLDGKFEADKLNHKPKNNLGIFVYLSALFFVVILIIVIIRSRGGGHGRGGMQRGGLDLFDILIISSMGSSHRNSGSFGGSNGSGSFGGGGFSGGFGGGSFGGGGAVGGW